jgi:hypothetical protein
MLKQHASGGNGFSFLYTVYKRTMAAVLLERRESFTHDVWTGCVGCNIARRDQDLEGPNAASAHYQLKV